MVCRYLRHDRGTIRLKSIEFESRSIHMVFPPKKVGRSRTGYDHVHSQGARTQHNTSSASFAHSSRFPHLDGSKSEGTVDYRGTFTDSRDLGAVAQIFSLYL